jgi:hypothetical protein
MMTQDQIMQELCNPNSKLNKARQIFSSYSAKIEQALVQRRPIGPIEVRGLEFEAVEKIFEILSQCL